MIIIQCDDGKEYRFPLAVRIDEARDNRQWRCLNISDGEKVIAQIAFDHVIYWRYVIDA